MKTTRFLAALVVLCLSKAVSAADEDPLLWSYRYILATATDFRDLGPVTKYLENDDNERSREMLDLAAELVAARTNIDKNEERPRSELVRVLARSKDPRYFSLLSRIAHEIADSEARRLAGSAMGRKKIPATDQFQAGMSNAATLRDEYAKAALTAVPTDEFAQAFVNARRKTLSQVFATYGRPQAVSSRYRRLSPSYSYERIELYYRGIGRAELLLEGSGWRVHRVLIAPLAYEDYMPYRIDPAKYGQISDEALAITQLLSDDAVAIRLTLDYTEHFDRASAELMDTVAERLLHDLKLVEMPLYQDDYNWMCVLLTRDGGRRYADVLATVAQLAKAEKTKVFAAEAVDESKLTHLPPYVPGTLSLEAQRARYPTLYPQRTYYFGRP